MYLRQIISTLQSQQQLSSSQLDQLQRDLKLNEYIVMYEKEDTLQEFLQLFQSRILTRRPILQQDQQQQANDFLQKGIENVLIQVLGSLVFEGKMDQISDLKLFNLVSILSTKIKLSGQSNCLSVCLSLGVIYAYIGKKFCKKVQDFNPTHKKIKQKFEEDSKHFYKLTENVFSHFLQTSSNNNNNNNNNGSLLNMTHKYLQYLRAIISRWPNLFKAQKTQFERLFQSKVLFADFEGRFQQEIESEVYQILSLLPNCINRQADYHENLQNSLDFYFTQLQNLQNVLSYTTSLQEQESAPFDADFGKISAENNQNETAVEEEEVEAAFDPMSILISKQYFNKFSAIKVISRLGKVIQLLVNNIKENVGIEIELKKYLAVLTRIITEDVEFLDKSKAVQAKLADKLIQISLEKPYSILNLDEYREVSIYFKEAALKIVSQFVLSVGSTFSLHLDWLYNTFYFLSQHILKDYALFQLPFNKNLKAVLEVLQVQMGDFCQYYIFDSMLSPLHTTLCLVQLKHQQEKSKNELKVQDEMQFTKQRNKKHVKHVPVLSFKTENKDQLQQQQQQQSFISEYVESLKENKTLSEAVLKSNLKILQSYLKFCGQSNTSAEHVGKIDAVILKLFIYPKIIAECYKRNTKTQLLKLLEQTLHANCMKLEENLLVQEFHQFVLHYQKYETDSEIQSMLVQILALFQQIRLSKKISNYDNSIVIGAYLEAFERALEEDNFICSTVVEKEQEGESITLKRSSNGQDSTNEREDDEPKVSKKIKANNSEQEELKVYDNNNNDNDNDINNNELEGWGDFSQQNNGDNNQNKERQQKNNNINNDLIIEEEPVDLAKNLGLCLDDEEIHTAFDEKQNNNQEAPNAGEEEFSIDNMPKPCFD